MEKVEGPGCFEITIWCKHVGAKLTKGGLRFYLGADSRFKSIKRSFYPILYHIR